VGKNNPREGWRKAKFQPVRLRLPLPSSQTPEASYNIQGRASGKTSEDRLGQNRQ
jgi:hypothetical protein